MRHPRSPLARPTTASTAAPFGPGPSPAHRTSAREALPQARVVALPSGVLRWGTDVWLGCGLGAFAAALASVPLVLEASCRWLGRGRAYTASEIERYGGRAGRRASGRFERQRPDGCRVVRDRGRGASLSRAWLCTATFSPSPHPARCRLQRLRLRGYTLGDITHRRYRSFAGHVSRIQTHRLVRRASQRERFRHWRIVQDSLPGGGLPLRHRHLGVTPRVWEIPLEKLCNTCKRAPLPPKTRSVHIQPSACIT